MTAEKDISLLALPPGTEPSVDIDLSAQMEPGKTPTGLCCYRVVRTVDHPCSVSSSTTPLDRKSYSPERLPHIKMLTSKNSLSSEFPSRVKKREANTVAARQHRQKRVNQISGLEAELKAIKAERDDMKFRCAELESEVEALSALLRL